jgi:hypothetical protein
MPDPVVAIGVDGIIKFCSVPMERVLKHKSEDLVGANIEDLIVPGSRCAIQRLIKDLVTAEQQVATNVEAGGQGELNNDSDLNENDKNSSNGLGDSSNETNANGRSSDKPFPLLEVNVDEEDEVGYAENISDSSGDPPTKKDGKSIGKHKTTIMSSLTEKSSSLSTETSMIDDNEQPPKKKAKRAKVCDARSMNIDDVMGASVTANNASAKLSSLMHQKQTLEKQDSSEDSGYRESYESSDEDAEDSSSISVTTVPLKKKGKKHRPLAPACNVRLVRKDLTTVWCELTSSIRTRTVNDEDNELGIIDHNPKAAIDGVTEATEEEEKELLLCFRPNLEGRKVGEELRFPRRSVEIKNDNKATALSKCMNSKASASLDVVSSSTLTQTEFSTNPTLELEMHRPPKKRTFAVSEDLTNGNWPKPRPRHRRVKINERQQDEESAAESLMMMHNDPKK